MSLTGLPSISRARQAINLQGRLGSLLAVEKIYSRRSDYSCIISALRGAKITGRPQNKSDKRQRRLDWQHVGRPPYSPLAEFNKYANIDFPSEGVLLFYEDTNNEDLVDIDCISNLMDFNIQFLTFTIHPMMVSTTLHVSLNVYLKPETPSIPC
ncbi:hypothetical protein J6590_011443 [Homalodisca vitripennis]|nr:hypothetical protein J6590_011443 [Homalodisca vitripennis]